MNIFYFGIFLIIMYRVIRNYVCNKYGGYIIISFDSYATFSAIFLLPELVISKTVCTFNKRYIILIMHV